MTDVRERLGFLVGGLAAILIFVAMSSAAVADPGPDAALARADAEVTGGGKTAAEELAEKKAKRLTKLQRRLDALAAAEAAGQAGQPGPKAGVAAAPGWAGELPMDSVGDDWEPAIAADRTAPYVYVLTTRYGAPKPCPGNCPTPWIALEISADGGATRRLRGDGHHEHRESDRDLGRRVQLGRSRRILVQPAALSAATAAVSLGVEPRPSRAPTRAAYGGSR